MESPSQDRDKDLQDVGISDSGVFATVHGTQLPQFMSSIPEPQALAVLQNFCLLELSALFLSTPEMADCPPFLSNSGLIRNVTHMNYS